MIHFVAGRPVRPGVGWCPRSPTDRATPACILEYAKKGRILAQSRALTRPLTKLFIFRRHPTIRAGLRRLAFCSSR
jgi:hypothetical protein